MWGPSETILPHASIVVSGTFDDELLGRVSASHALAYLTKPYKADDLIIAIELARKRWGEFHEVLTQSNELRQALEDRKVIERAKGILMKMSQLDETSAFRYLPKLSIQTRSRAVSYRITYRSRRVNSDLASADGGTSRTAHAL